MRIVELSYQQFDEFAKYHPLSSYCQTSKYAIVMSSFDYNYDYLGMVDENNKIVAATLVLTKKIKSITKYGYAPKGFLVNYYDQRVLHEFLDLIRKYYKDKGYIFVKFNPEIIIGETDKSKNYVMAYNGNVRIIDDLKTQNVKRRVELKEFDLMTPKFNAYINLKEYDVNKLNRNYRKKIKKGYNLGMSLILGTPKDIDILYNFIKNKTQRPITYYRNLYNIFNRDNSIDLVFIQLDYGKYLSYVKEQYEKEQARNDEWNNIIQRDPKQKYLNRKMDSDKKLQGYKDKVVEATNGLKKHPTAIIAGALVIKHFSRTYIVMSGFGDEYRSFNPNHFLHHAIFERYKPYFRYCDLNGISGVFDETSAYHGLNEFKLNFKPNVYEYVGEFDLICNDSVFKKLIKTSFIEDEFTKE